jgi:hypothetical protein
MPIITQAGLTALRSLKYGRDTQGGGDSGEPYITQKIPPPYEQQVPSTNLWLSDNGLIRGGFRGATVASALDTLRIGKFLVDPPRGPLFIAKQVGLQLTNPQLERRTDAVGQLLGAVGPTRIYNLGINTLAQVPLNAFGGHIVRHGLFPVLNESQLYYNVVRANNSPENEGANNKLVLLKAKLQANPNAYIADYVSGPGSVDGIGRTRILRVDNTLSNPQYNRYVRAQVPNFNPATGNLGSVSTNLITSTNLANLYIRPTPNVDYFLTLGASEQYYNYNQASIETNIGVVTSSLTTPPTFVDQTVVNYSSAGRTYNALRSAIAQETGSFAIGKANIVQAGPNNTGVGTINTQGNVTAPITFTYNVNARSTYKEGTGKYKDGLPLNEFNIEKRLGLPGANKRDDINAIPLYVSDAPPGAAVVYVNGKPYNPRDIIKFRIEAVDNDKPSDSVWMVFRALLTDITDNPSPSWNTVNYVGRGEPFYIYNGFERTISFNFQVAAMSEGELKPMWQKLNYLYSNVMPDYSNNIMRAPYMKMTIGNYIYRQPGIIKNLTFSIDNKAPWEIAITDPERGEGEKLYELPQVLSVQMTFAPIHSFLPRKFPGTFSGDWQNLPAFTVDRPDNKNKWLQDVFLTEGKDASGQPIVGEKIPVLTR